MVLGMSERPQPPEFLKKISSVVGTILALTFIANVIYWVVKKLFLD